MNYCPECGNKLIKEGACEHCSNCKKAWQIYMDGEKKVFKPIVLRDNPFTNEEYRNHQGLLCPFCESEDIETDGPFDSENMVQRVSCNNCNNVWEDTYELTGYELTNE